MTGARSAGQPRSGRSWLGRTASTAQLGYGLSHNPIHYADARGIRHSSRNLAKLGFGLYPLVSRVFLPLQTWHIVPYDLSVCLWRWWIMTT